MFRTPFHISMKEGRLRIGLTQKKAAEACCVSRDRWSQLERGYRFPEPDELAVIATFLDLKECYIAPPGVFRQLHDFARAAAPNGKPFISHQDRPTYVRYRSCLRAYPEPSAFLTSLVGKRSDLDRCEYVCHRTSCDSALEVLFLLYLLARGAKPGFLAPAELGRTPHPIVDDMARSRVDIRPRPCLLFEGKFYFFQVSFSVPQTVRVDVLRWDNGWSVLEINGLGHDDRRDDWKGQAVGLSVVYFSESDVISRIATLTQLPCALQA